MNKYMHDKSQTRRLIIFLSILILVGFVATSLISYFVSRASLRKQIVIHELPLTSDNIYSEIQRDLLAPVFISSMMANDSFLRNWVISGEHDVDKITQYLQTIQSKYGTFTSFMVSDKTKVYYQSKGILKTVKQTEPRDAWYFRVRDMKPHYEINVDPDMANKDTMTIFINHKVFDFKGNFIGATGVGLKVSAVKLLIDTYHKKYKRNIYFIDPDGKIVLSSSSTHSSIDNIKNISGMSSVINRILSEPELRIEYPRSGRTFFLNSRYVPELKWYLLVEQSADSATADIFSTLILNLALCGLVTLIVIAITSLALYSYQRKLQEVVRSDFQLKLINKDQQEEIDKQNLELLESNRKLTQLNKSKDTLFSIISHDLRSPVGNIYNLLEMLDDELKEESSKEIKDIMSSLKEISGSTVVLLDNLFDWAKSQISGISYNCEEVKIADMLRECMSLQKNLAEDKNIFISLNCDSGLKVMSNANMVKAVIRNLLSNAVKFTPTDGRICIDAISRGDEVAISVHDSGIGIEPGKLSSIFDFVQNKSTAGTHGERGAGLGLALCRDLARLNDGDLAVISEPGAGSSFTLTLKAPKTPEAE